MSWFRRGTADPDEKARIAAEEASISALGRGELPLNAQRRLEEVRNGAFHSFTSDLSFSELLLSGDVGLRPICQVAGSSIYRMVDQISLMGSGEVRVLSDGINESRALAFQRLKLEAERVDAHAVLAVHMVGRRLPLSVHAVEFTAIGTAVRLDGETEMPTPSISNLSGQDFWKLYRAGYWPVGVCASTAVYNVYSPTYYAGPSAFGGLYNRELPHFSEGMYRARSLAMRRVHQQAEQLDASGLVGMAVESQRETGEVQRSDGAPSRMTFTFNVIGTAIARVSGAPEGNVHIDMALNLSQ